MKTSVIVILVLMRVESDLIREEHRPTNGFKDCERKIARLKKENNDYVIKGTSDKSHLYAYCKGVNMKATTVLK